MTTGLLHAHMGMGWLLLATTGLSVVLAIVGAITGAPRALVRTDAVITRGVSVALGGLLFVFGLGLWIGRYPLTEIWIWIGVVVVGLQGVLVARGIKPNLAKLRDGGGSKGVWVGLAAAHHAIVWLAFLAMTQRW